MESFWAQIVKKALFAPKSLFGPKSAFWALNALLAQKVTFGRKVRFWAKSSLWNSHELTYLLPFLPSGRHDAPKSDFCSKITFWLQNRIFALFATLGPKVHFLRKSALLRPHAAEAYKTHGILMKMEPFWAQKRFWTKKCIPGSKINFGAQNAKMIPKCIFGPKSAFFAKGTKKLTTASACRIENRDSRIRARTASTGGRGSWNM